MKPKNFPARKLRRKIIANNGIPFFHQNDIDLARSIRTKKRRAAR